MVNAVVLDSAQLVSQVAGAAVDSYPGLWEADGHLLVDYVYHSLRSCPEISRIGMLVPSPYRDTASAGSADAVDIARRGYLVEQLLEMVEQLGSSQPCVVFPTNAPLATSEMFSRFLSAVPAGSVLAYAVHRKERVLERFPVTRNWPDQAFREGEVVASRLLYFRHEVLEDHADLLSGMLGGRVAYLQLLGQLGAAFALRLKMGRLGLAEVAKKVSEIVGGHSAVVLSRDPELAFTVDSSTDLELARRELEAV